MLFLPLQSKAWPKLSPGKKIRRGKARVVWACEGVRKVEEGRTYYEKALVNGDEVRVTIIVTSN